MRSPGMGQALAAVVAAAVVARSEAFVAAARPPLSRAPPACTRRSLLRRSAQLPAPLRRGQRARRTRRPAQADSAYPDSMPSLPGMKTIVETEEEEELRAAREWQDGGRKGRVLLRRKEVPTPEMAPASVCQLIFECLQNNDDPMLDYGAAVAIKFASSKSAVKGLTPAEYGAFLRSDPDYGLLIDNASCAPAERAKVSPDGNQVLQKVEVVGRYPEKVRRVAEVQLRREEDKCWRVDAIILGPVLEKQA